MPLFIEVDRGTSDRRMFTLNPLALYMLACGWGELQLVVLPVLPKGGKYGTW